MSAIIYTGRRNDLPGLLEKDAGQYLIAPGIENVYVLVPDQLTLETELALMERLQLEGSFRLNVLSTKRLCGRIREACGSGRRIGVDERGRAMLMGYLLRQHAGELGFFTGSVNKAGFETRLVEEIRRFRQAGVGAEELERMSENAPDDALRARLKDIVLLSRLYEEKLSGLLQDGEVEIEEALESLKRSDFLHRDAVLVYGFDITTAMINRLLTGIGACCAGMSVYLPIPPETNADASTYLPLRKAARRLEEELTAAGVPYTVMKAPIVRMPSKVQSVVGRLYSRPQAYPPFTDEGIKLVMLKNPLEEARYVAASIRELARLKGWKYSDMTVLIDDAASYLDVLEEAFGEYDVPFFTQQAREASRHPLCAFLLETLALVSGRAQSVSALCETGYTPLEQSEAEALLAYCASLKLRPSALLKPFSRGSGEMVATCEPIRQKLAEPVARLKDRIKNASSLDDQLRALHEYLLEANCFEKSEEHRQRLSMLGENRLAADDVRIINEIFGVFDQMKELFGSAPFPMSTLGDLIKRALEAAVVKVLPQSPDAVQICQPQRAGMKDVKAVFLMHAAGESEPQQDGVFDEEELKTLSGMCKKYLAPDSMDMTRTRRMYLKDALALARECVTVTYPGSDMAGSALSAGAVIGEFKRVSPGLEVKGSVMGDTWIERTLLVSPRGALEYISSGFSQIKAEKAAPALVQAVRLLEEDGRLGLIRKAVQYETRSERIAPSLARKLYPNRVSVSKLEKFAQCPFRHFVEEGLRPIQDKPFGIDPIQRGIVLHACVEKLLKQGKLTETDEDGAERIMQAVFDEELSGSAAPYARDSATAFAQMKILKRAAGRAARLLYRQLRKGVFRPVEMELRFGPKDIEMIRLRDGSEVRLDGQIDRVDLGQHGENRFAFVVDYKTGHRELRPEEIYFGLQLQLLVYLAVVLRRYRAQSAGVYYFRIADKLVNTESRVSSEVDKERSKSLRMKGLAPRDPALLREMCDSPERLISVEFNKDGNLSAEGSYATQEEFDRLMNHALKRCREITQDIMDGKTDISPAKSKSMDACRYCDSRLACLRDGFIRGGKYRKPRPMKFSQLHETLFAEEIRN